jgi:hypothetical protein
MDCLSLLENTCGNKSLHFANATQLFTFNQIYSLHYWRTVVNMHDSIFNQGEIDNIVYMMTSVYHCFNTQRQLFAEEKDLHLCESATEFLLEPWLLMQVPWHPPVYMQWLLAALAEVLKAKHQLIEFTIWLVPRQLLATVKTLLSLVETLNRRIIYGFDLINCLTNSNQERDSGFDINCQTAECILNMIVLPSLPTIEFLLGDQFSIVVRTLKRLTWPSEGKATAEKDVYAHGYRGLHEAEAMRPIFSSALIELASTHLFGKICCLQDIKEELAQLQCKNYVDEVELSKNMVSL